MGPAPAPAPAPPQLGWVSPPAPSSTRSRAYLIGFAPLVFFVFFALAAPGFLAPMFDTTVPTGGVALGLSLLAVAAALMLVGVAVMWRFPSVLGVAVGIVGFTFPSLFLVILGPAICLIAQNLVVD